jgi:hypothetical protein
MDQENVVFICNGILLSHEEEIDGTGEHHSKRG